MKVGSLFSGIGGLELGLERAGMTTIWQSEMDPYASKVLAKNFPGVPNLGDITKIDWSQVERPDLVCGGFPCQPVSEAGKRLGADDSRWLWPQFHRCLRELRPKYALIENVPGLFNRGFGGLLADLASSGFDAEWDCIPAGAVGAHFLGDRLFIVATCASPGGGRWEGSRPLALGAHPWGRDEFEGLVRLEIQHGVPAGSLGRISDGLSHRVDRLRCLGNAVVPQVAEVVGRWIMAQERVAA